MNEEWKSVVGFEDRYEVSSFGRMRSLGAGGRRGRILKPQRGAGAFHVTLRKGDKPISVRMHRAVLEAFAGPPPPGKPYGLHWDGNPANNRLDNLRWGSQKENCEDSARHGTKLLGETQNSTKLTALEVMEIRRAYAAGGVTMKRLGDLYGVHRITVLDAVRGRTWTHLKAA
jgi:hypothetical protein